MLVTGMKELYATGEPSTYFQIYIPPNGDAVRRDVALIVTAIYDSTSFQIIDDGADGDTDDSKTGMLMAGQSYVLYIRDNGINDDARYASGGTLKWDGDYFIVKSSKLVYASQSTNSDWQHDWVPSTDKKSIGQKFIIYSPVYSSSKRDINVFAYESNTTVVFKKISWQPKINSGYTDVNTGQDSTVFTRKLNPGEDIIYKYSDGRDVMGAGETYMLIADKPVTVQYGALYGNERDGGGYVPTSNGSSSGQLLYFAVPFQYSNEQEIRIVSWDAANTVQLERYSNGSWVVLKSYTLGKMQAGDWVAKTEGNTGYATVFRISCTAGKRVSVFEGNWFETGSPGTSDMATMVSAENGTTAGTRFLTYMAPPGNEQNAVDPFTGKAWGQQLTHLYLFAREGATVTVKDAYSGGTKFSRSYTIGAERYVDCYLTLADWKNIYNGTGTPSGPARPYLLVESSQPISVMNSNFNDNWMCYTGSSLGQNFTQDATVTQSAAIPTDTARVVSYINTGSAVSATTVQVLVDNGLKVAGSTFSGPSGAITGTVRCNTSQTIVDFANSPTLAAGSQYKVETTVVAAAGDNSNTPLTKSVNSTVETIVTGVVAGQVQQSSVTEVVNVNPLNTSKLIFSRFTDNVISKDTTDSWMACWVDVNNDGYDDLFVTDRRSNAPNIVYTNNKNGTFSKHTANSFVADSAITMSAVWADMDNDGDADLLVVNNTRKPNVFYRNKKGTLVKDNTPAFTRDVSYYHGVALADMEKDGRLDVFLCNYFPTRYNELYRCNAQGGYDKQTGNVIPLEANQSTGPTWADYDGDGYPDLFVPNGNGFKNSLFHNEGNGSFTKPANTVNADGGQSVGSCWGDIDNDGDMDLFVTNSNATGNFLYRNNGDGSFTRVTQGAAVTDKGSSHGCSFADIDNDGDVDLYVTNDTKGSFLYLNDGKGNFTRKTDEVTVLNFGNAMGHAWSDFDNDGDLDLCVATHSKQVNALFTNNGNQNQWLQIKLTGTVSNTAAIGAVIRVKTGNTWQLREVNSQSGFGGQSSLTQHFGLSTAAMADTIVVKWPSGIIQVLTHIPAKQILLITEPQSVPLTGVVFADLNNNCRKDAGEQFVARAAVDVIATGNRLFTNDAGVFTTRVTEGTWQLKPAAVRGVTAGCGNTTVTVSGTGRTDTVWLAVTPVCSQSNAEVMMGSTALRKGYTNNQFAWVVTNNGRGIAPQIIAKLKMPATVQPAATSIPLAGKEIITENGVRRLVLTWNAGSLQPFESRTITFNHGLDAAVAIGDTVTFTTWLEGVTEDCDFSNNKTAQTYKVVGAIDPNDLQVAPVGYGAEGYIQPSDVLTYTIRFQNMGNYPAADVAVTDVLPQGLNMATLKVISASTPGFTMQTHGNTVVFHFSNLFLPGAAADSAASQGYITFSIAPVPDIWPGTQLKNQAVIQFDQYLPIATNQVLNTIQTKRQEEEMIIVSVYPNPASDVIYFQLKHKMGKYTGKNIRYVTLSSISGQELYRKIFHPGEEWRLNLPPGLNGVVVLNITDTDGRMYAQKVLVQKNGYGN